MSQTKAQLIDPVDGTIVNADINASAAIAGSKISPDFGSQNIATTGNVSIGGTNLNMATAYIDFSGSISTPSTAAAIYRPADNQLAFSTANTERVKITNSGLEVTGAITGTGNLTVDTNTLHVDSANNRVGVGTTTPDNTLDLGSSTAGRALTFASYSNIFSEHSSGSVWLANNFYGNAGASGYKTSVTGNFGAAAVRCHATGGGSNSGIIQFFTDDNASKTAGDAFTPTERMRIDEDGKVGIGVTSNGAQLHVEGGTEGNLIQLSNTHTGATTSDGFVFGINNSLTYLYNREDKHIAFGTNNLERMRIDNAGRLAIGTTSPQSHNIYGDNLVVASSTDTGISISGNDASTNYSSLIFSAGTTVRGYLDQQLNSTGRMFLMNTANGFIGFGTNNTERMRIESTGFVSGVYKPVKVVKNTNQGHTAGLRFVVPLPNTSRMFKIAGTFSFSGSGSGVIYADFGDWSDGHTVDIEGVALSFKNGATEDLDDLGNSRYQRVTPSTFDAFNLEVQYEIFITSQAFQNGNDTGNNAGGGRPGAFGHIRFTHSQIGGALTTFVCQDINATGTDRLQSFAWDIDGSTGSLGSGEHTYVLEEYPLT